MSITLLKIFPRSFSAFFSYFVFLLYALLVFKTSVFSTIKCSIASRVKDYTPFNSSKWLIWHFGKQMGKVSGEQEAFLEGLLFMCLVFWPCWALLLLRGLLWLVCVLLWRSWLQASAAAPRGLSSSWVHGPAALQHVGVSQNRWNRDPCSGRQFSSHWVTRKPRKPL